MATIGKNAAGRIRRVQKKVASKAAPSKGNPRRK